ncbi:MAG: hypothetical protein WD059_08095 [Balneolaceae bacterium]
MSSDNIKPELITKPIQLLAAWLIGLLSINSSFLYAAVNMDSGAWHESALVIAAIANVPLFLLAVFLLQTKFRPELQEDHYYSTYLNQKTNQIVKVPISKKIDAKLINKIQELEKKTSQSTVKSNDHDLKDIPIGINKHLSNIDEIKKRLSQEKVLGISLFGVDAPPSLKLVSISKYLPDELVPTIVSIAKEVGFKYYTRFDNIAEKTEEQILFGAYGKEGLEII